MRGTKIETKTFVCEWECLLCAEVQQNVRDGTVDPLTVCPEEIVAFSRNEMPSVERLKKRQKAGELSDREMEYEHRVVPMAPLGVREIDITGGRLQQFAIDGDHPFARGLEAGPPHDMPWQSRKANFMMPYGHLLALRELLRAARRDGVLTTEADRVRTLFCLEDDG